MTISFSHAKRYASRTCVLAAGQTDLDDHGPGAAVSRKEERSVNGDAERPALEDFAHTVSGAAQLLDSMVHSTRTPPELRAALDLLCTALNTTVKKANVLIDEIGIDLSQSLGVSTAPQRVNSDCARAPQASVVAGVR